MKNEYTPKDMKPGTIFKNNSGQEFEIENYINWSKVFVYFPETGYRGSFQATHIRAGRVSDKLHPSICGVGFIGVGSEKSKSKGRNTEAYDRWANMIKRCYSKKFQSKNPAYKGCSVREDWHNFQNFAKWFYDNYPNDGLDYHLDKDSIVKGNKVYSEDTCVFLSPEDNSKIAHEKEYELVSPSGDLVKIKNLTSYCKENGINRSGLSMLACGGLKSYKGWTMP